MLYKRCSDSLNTNIPPVALSSRSRSLQETRFLPILDPETDQLGINSFTPSNGR